jgi:hypothetical protein
MKSKPRDIPQAKSTSDVLAHVIGSNVDAVLSSSPASTSFDQLKNESGNRLSTFHVGSETSNLSSDLISMQDQQLVSSGFDPNSNLTLK